MKERLAIFVFYDSEGVVSEYIDYLLKCLCEYVSSLVVVCNGSCNQAGISIFKKYTEEIYFRENIGLDAGAYKEAILEFVGLKRVRNFDELLLLNDTFFGPLYSFEKIFNTMDMRNVDFWGITLQRDTEFFYGKVPENIQSYFLAFERSVIQSECFDMFWKRMPVPRSFVEDCIVFENSLTKYFSDNGFRYDVFVNSDIYNAWDKNYNHTWKAPCSIIRYQQMPFLKIKPFEVPYDADKEQSELFLALKYIREKTCYDTRMIFDHLLRKKSIDSLIYGGNMYELVDEMPIVKNCNNRLNEIRIIVFISRSKSLFFLREVVEELLPYKICVVSSCHKLLLEAEKCFHGTVDIFWVKGENRYSALFNLHDNILDSKLLIYIHDGITTHNMDGYIPCVSYFRKFIDNLLSKKQMLLGIYSMFNSENLGCAMVPISRQEDYSYVNLKLSDYRHIYRNTIMHLYDIKKLDNNHFEYLIAENGIAIRSDLVKKIKYKNMDRHLASASFLSMPQIIQSYGYYTRYISIKDYFAIDSKCIELLQRDISNILIDCGVKNLNDFKNEWHLLRMQCMLNNLGYVSRLYIYGTGAIAKRVYNRLRENKISIYGFIVSKCTIEYFYGVKVYTINDVVLEANDCVILGMNSVNQKEVIHFLNNKIADTRIISY